MDLHGAPGVLGTPHLLSGLPQPWGSPAQTQPSSASKGLRAGGVSGFGGKVPEAGSCPALPSSGVEATRMLLVCTQGWPSCFI